MPTRLEVVEAEISPSNSDDGHVESAVEHESLERREDLLECEISRRAEENEGVRTFKVHGAESNL
jgi:hypothetical protein